MFSHIMPACLPAQAGELYTAWKSLVAKLGTAGNLELLKAQLLVAWRKLQDRGGWRCTVAPAYTECPGIPQLMFGAADGRASTPGLRWMAV
jgi:hypothetical protein